VFNPVFEGSPNRSHEGVERIGEEGVLRFEMGKPVENATVGS
jgi:hypothetical protein